MLGAFTFQRNQVYATEISLWEVTAKQNPTSARAANNLGMAYAFACNKQRAAREFRRAIQLDDHDYQSRINLKLLERNLLVGPEARACVASPLN
jgi:Flp pilus assembly protein TadD